MSDFVFFFFIDAPVSVNDGCATASLDSPLEESPLIPEIRWMETPSVVRMSEGIQRVVLNGFGVFSSFDVAHSILLFMNQCQGRSQDFFKGGVTLCQTLSSSWRFRHGIL